MTPATERVPHEAATVARRLEALWGFVRRSVLLVEGGLLLVSLAVHVLSIGGGDSDDREPATVLALLPGLGHYLGADAMEFGDPTSHPYALSGGLWLTRIALLLLVVAILLASVATARLASPEAGRGVRGTAWVCAGLLVVLPLVVTLGQAWLPDSEVETTVVTGLFVPALAGVWLMSILRAVSALDE